MRALIFLRLMRIASCFQWRRKEYLVYGGLSFSSFSERYHTQSARPNSVLKPCLLISEKLTLGCPLFSKRKQKAQQETTIGTILRIKFKDKEYAHIKWRVPVLIRVPGYIQWRRGATAPLALRPWVFCSLCSLKRSHAFNSAGYKHKNKF